MTIKHLVLSGGGPVMFMAMGALQKLEQEQFWKREDIKGIYGTSAGAFVAVVVCLHYDWETVVKYFVERPWHEAFPITPATLIDAYGKKGVYDRSTMERIFKPLFDAKDISLSVTLKEFYELTGVCLHMYTFELHEFETVDMCHTTHPDVQLLDAVYMSCALPIIFSPLIVGDKCYLDGGIRTNYPLNMCIETEEDIDTDEILGFKNVYSSDQQESEERNHITDESSILDYVHLFLRKLVRNVNTENIQQNIKYEVTYQAKRLTMEYLQETLSSQDLRRELLHTGIESAITFLAQTKGVVEETTDANDISSKQSSRTG